MTESVEATSVEKVEKDLDLCKEACELLALGKKNFLIKDFEESLSCLGQACSMFAELYGEKAFECADAYHVYGKVLLEVARLESDVLGDAITGSGDEEDDDDVETGNKEGGKIKTDCVESNDCTEQENTDRPETDVSDPKEKCVDEKKPKVGENVSDTVENVSKDVSEDDNLPEGEEILADDLEDDGELTTLKHSWEMLELAKLIYQQHLGEKLVNLKLADVYLHLGLVGLESEMYDQAVSDIEECLKIQMEHLAEDDRLIAESYFNLGIAHALNNNTSESQESYSKSLNILLMKSKSLEKKLCEENLNDKKAIEDELEELKSIIPEVQEKINELDDLKAEASKLAEQLLKRKLSENGESSKNNASSSRGGNIASNISHLVRKKRKADEEVLDANEASKTVTDAAPAKVQKTE